jgi:hypothetical protein
MGFFVRRRSGEVIQVQKRSPFTVHRPPFGVHRSPFTVHRSAFTVRRSAFGGVRRDRDEALPLWHWQRGFGAFDRCRTSYLFPFSQTPQLLAGFSPNRRSHEALTARLNAAPVERRTVNGERQTFPPVTLPAATSLAGALCIARKLIRQLLPLDEAADLGSQSRKH